MDNGETIGIWKRSPHMFHITVYYNYISDYSKAFVCINYELLWKTLLEIGIPKHLIQLLKGLDEDQSAVIRT